MNQTIRRLVRVRSSSRTEADGCERIATDHPTFTWNVTAEGKPAKMIEDCLGCMGAPGLDTLRAADRSSSKAAVTDCIGSNK